jgi:hypothetical protein
MCAGNKRKRCALCPAWVPAKRLRLGYRVCTTCGEQQALQARRAWTVAPMGKSNYVLLGVGTSSARATTLPLLRGLNPKNVSGE